MVVADDQHSDGAAAIGAELGIQVFSSPSDAPRVRWQSDLVSAGLSTALLGLLALVAGNGSSLDVNTLAYVGTLPGWFLWLGQAVYAVGVIYAFGLLIGVGLFARHRLELLRDLMLAAVLAAVIALALTILIDDRWPEFAFFDLQDPRETFPAFSITSAAAIQAAASPHLTTPMRKIGWTFILAAVAAAIIGGVTTVSDALGGVLVGLIAAAIIRFVFGTTAGLPSTNRVRAGLADLGVAMGDLRYGDDQPAGAAILEGVSAAGDPLFISLLGHDAWNTRQWTRWWREAWYQDVGAQYGSDRRQQVEHEALAQVLAEQADVPVPGLVAVGVTTHGDALLVTALLDHSLRTVPPDDVDDAMLDAIWGLVTNLHGAGLSHGSLDDRHIWFDSDGVPSLAGFSEAAIHPTDEQIHQDIVAMLVMTTLIVRSDQAIAAARRAVGDDRLTAALPALQTAALNARLRNEVKAQKLKIGDLREETAASLGTDIPNIEQLTRVTWTNVLMLAFIGFAVYTIIGGLADVGFDTIANTLSDARWGLVILGLVFAQATNFTDAFALKAVSPKPVPVGVTTLEQFAIGFVNIAVPSSAGRIATNARFFQKFGISAVTSTATGAITSVVGLAAQAVLVVLTIIIGAGSIDLSSLQGDGGAIRLVVMAIIIFVIVFVVVLAVPRWRHWVEDTIRTPLAQIGDALKTLKSPRTVITALGSSLGSEILYGAGFALCVLAVGGSISLGEAVFINVTVSLFAGLMPVPGGVGVTEAGMTAGLAAIGVPSDIAVGAVLLYRLVSYYLPPFWGYVSLRWLTKHDYL